MVSIISNEIYTDFIFNVKYKIHIKLTKMCAKERYNTHAKSCNSILYTKINSATYICSDLCVVYSVNSYQTMHF